VALEGIQGCSVRNDIIKRLLWIGIAASIPFWVPQSPKNESTNMVIERQPRVQSLFHAAYERKAEERAPFLDEACGSDQTLRSEVELVEEILRLLVDDAREFFRLRKRFTRDHLIIMA
jgi:hypothetical protein